MPRFVIAVLLATLLAACAANSQHRPTLAAGVSSPSVQTPVFDDDDDGGGIAGGLYDIAMYIPNRILDVLDIVRARVRLGPGFGIGVRATDVADVFLGSYASIYVGLPGPRGRRTPRLPFGLESKSGLEASLADATVEGGIGPDYGATEFGLDLQILLIGVAVGIDPLELVDLPLGFLGIDIQDDDL